jgi:hypothetical protein
MNNGKSNWTLTFLFTAFLLCIPMKASAGTAATSDFIDKLELNGDLRVRYEQVKKDVDNEDKNDRWRQRFRLGMKWNNPEECWKIAAGLATGGSDATSTNDTYSDDAFFDTGDIRLDYAYAEHKMESFKFLAGQQKNPWETTWLFWDSDVRPVGLTGQFTMDQFFLTAGGYDVKYIDKDVAYMYAVQGGAKMDMLTAALGFYTYNRVDEILDSSIAANLDEDYGYDIIDFYVSSDIKADPVKLTPYGQVFYNMGAEGEEGQSVIAGLDPEEENLGWIVGCDAKIDQFSIGLAYTQVGADSVLQGLKDADFGSALNSTDVEGFRVDLGYKISKNFGLSTTGMFYEAKERDLDQDPTTYQIDMNYKF